MEQRVLGDLRRVNVRDRSFKKLDNKRGSDASEKIVSKNNNFATAAADSL